MVATTIIAKLRAFAGVVAASVALVSAPAFANSSANADIAAPLRAAQASVQDKGDTQFRQLFASWRALDKGVGFAASAPSFTVGARSVSIPSRNPLDGVRLTSEFGMRVHPVLGGRRMHQGIDLSSPIGTPVHATADGMVGRADWFSSYGLFISIAHGAAMETRYGHLSRLNVAAGQFVRKGDVIGYVGSTGRSTGAHLHYEVRVEGLAVNPIPYMQSDAGVKLASAAGATGGFDAGDE